MADGWASIDEPPPSAVDKRVDAEQITVNGTSVLRQRIRIAGDGASEYADVENGELKVVDDGLGTDGASPPVIDGTGVRGWLRAIYDRLGSGIGRAWSLASGTDSVTAVGPLTDSELRASAVPVSGTVTAQGPLTNTELRASAVPVMGPLTDSELRATALPVSGPLTDTELRASNVAVNVAAALPAGANVVGKVGLDPDVSNYTTSSGAKRVGDGQAWICGRRLPNVASGSTATWSLKNISTTHLLYITEVRMWNTATDALQLEFHRDSTITGGTTLTPWNPNMAIAPPAHETEFVVGTGIRSGGTKLEVEAQCVRDEGFDPDDLLVVVPPGVSLQVSVVVPGTLSSQTITGSARWFKVPI